ncbi:MAG: nucleoside/nucleotide kinase family protein [Acidimicrobiales bacterium]
MSALEARARELTGQGRRAVLGIAGAPGAGKSTLAGLLIEGLGPMAALVPMDGFHLAQVELERLGRASRKGAPDTFDVHGYIALLDRLHHELGETVYAPAFRRDLEEPIAGAIPVPPSVRLVVTEGNYLLDAAPPWDRLRALLDEAWYVELDEQVRLSRLVARHVAFGRSLDEARQWALVVDQPNAERVFQGRDRADVIVRSA